MRGGWLLLGLGSAACARAGTPDVARADPSTDAAPPPADAASPSSPPSPSSPSSPSVTDAGPPKATPSYASVTAGETATHFCEPVVTCGVWSGCKWLEKIDATHARDGKTRYVRRHECASPGAGPLDCALFCSAPDAGPPCVDGFHPEIESCKATAAPRPTTARCLVGDGVCGSLL